MNHSDDTEIETLLRAQFDGAVPDDGFSDRVMQQLPPRRRRAAWPLAGGIVAGMAACWLSLVSTPLLQAGWQNWISGELSASAVILMSVIAGMSLLACWWTTMEAEDH
ncbi:MAG TPA: DUF5056 domain-containing protein [Tahibacter sp.]|uniref:DUF5056 domain-containing protein n=1 Tax=Tahibacter sp. TaxID=2056211 RepID=UPI002BF1A192|nr:DUF5056 domain-containing protein [Tahibacter sp.]HSX59975.1 DUF5056 domain-containing protein [Tahibacter sp.]